MAGEPTARVTSAGRGISGCPQEFYASGSGWLSLTGWRRAGRVDLSAERDSSPGFAVRLRLAWRPPSHEGKPSAEGKVRDGVRTRARSGEWTLTFALSEPSEWRRSAGASRSAEVKGVLPRCR